MPKIGTLFSPVHIQIGQMMNSPLTHIRVHIYWLVISKNAKFASTNIYILLLITIFNGTYIYVTSAHQQRKRSTNQKKKSRLPHILSSKNIFQAHIQSCIDYQLAGTTMRQLSGTTQQVNLY